MCFVVVVYHDYRVRILCKYPCPVSGMTLSVHFFTSFLTLHWHSASCISLSHLPFFGLDLLPVGLPFALCLQHVCSLTFTCTCFPPHTATRRVPGTLFHCSPGGLKHSTVFCACPRAGTPGWQGVLELGSVLKGICTISVSLARDELEISFLAVVWPGWIIFDGEVRDYWALVGTRGRAVDSGSGRWSVLVLLLSCLLLASQSWLSGVLTWHHAVPPLRPLLHHRRHDSFLPSVHICF